MMAFSFRYISQLGFQIFILSFVFIGYAKANNCAVHINQYEQRYGIPAGLLHAISKVESGRKNKEGHFVAWPWTVNAQGKSYYFPTKEAAIVAVRSMQLRGVGSIDVGCMQINLHHHPKAFRNLNDAFEPSKNVAYAALFLNQLKNTHASWPKAVSHYHSANPSHNIPYRKNVLTAWQRDMKSAKASMTSAVIESNSPSSPKIVRLKRLSTISKAKFEPNGDTQSRLRGVRRVNRVSRYVRRVASRNNVSEHK